MISIRLRHLRVRQPEGIAHVTDRFSSRESYSDQQIMGPDPKSFCGLAPHPLGHNFLRLAKGIIVEVGLALGRYRICMSKESSNYSEAQATGYDMGGMGVEFVVDTVVGKISRCRDCIPEALKVLDWPTWYAAGEEQGLGVRGCVLQCSFQCHC